MAADIPQTFWIPLNTSSPYPVGSRSEDIIERMFDFIRCTPLKPPPGWGDFRAWLLALNDEDRLYVRRWIFRYVNRWGQIPVASSFRASTALTDKGPRRVQ